MLQKTSRNALSALFLGLCFFLLSITAHAEGVFIPASKRVDTVYDDARGVLYITNGAQLLRYKLDTASFLTPLKLGGALKGIDISPDGNFLAVANTNHSTSRNWIHLVDLNTWTATQVKFQLSSGESGTYSVAYGSDGAILITSAYEGSGWIPLRKYDPATGTTTTIQTINDFSMLSASADRSVIALAEGNNSSGPYGKYVVSTGAFDNSGSTNWSNFEIAANPKGSRFAIPTYGGTFIVDRNLVQTGTTIGEYAGGQPIAAVFHPTKARVYFPWADSRSVKVYNTQTWQPVREYDFENTFDHTGNSAYGEGRIKISKDGALLFVTVNGGVRYVTTKE